MEKKTVVGASVDAKMTLFEVADLSAVWIEADVYEKDIPFLQVGQEIEATVESCPNRTFTGKLALIYPRLEAATRTNRVRLKLDNPQHELRPGMFATVRINTPLESIEPFKSAAAKRGRMVPVGLSGANSPPQYEFLCVPERAVIDTGSKRSFTWSASPECLKEWKLNLDPGRRLLPGNQGAQPGDKVAAAGGFLIDAETRLNPAAAATYFGASGGPQSAVVPAHRRSPIHASAGRDPGKSDQPPASDPAAEG